MTLPTFLGIGVPRAGTTWLHTLLASHPDVYLPTKRKEVRFFDQHYERGLEWYEAFFCGSQDAANFKVIGEISPQYLYCPACPERIARDLPTVKLIVILRHPVDRAYSNYGFLVQRKNYKGSFEEFLATRPDALRKGFYSQYLLNYLRVFDRSQILALVFEDAVGEGTDIRAVLAAFLGVSAGSFPPSLNKVNASSLPKHPSVSSFAVRTGRYLRSNHFETIVDLGARLGGRRLLVGQSRLAPLHPELKRDLSRLFEEDIDALEKRLEIDLSRWK